MEYNYLKKPLNQRVNVPGKWYFFSGRSSEDFDVDSNTEFDAHFDADLDVDFNAHFIADFYPDFGKKPSNPVDFLICHTKYRSF